MLISMVNFVDEHVSYRSANPYGIEVVPPSQDVVDRGVDWLLWLYMAYDFNG